jgi:predicted O-methyltransferase YrrM
MVKPKFLPMTQALSDYVQRLAVQPHPILEDIALATQNVPKSYMLTGREQAGLLYLLVKLIDAKKVIDVGCYTGHSAAALASALPPDGQVITIEFRQDRVQMAQTFFEQAGLDNKITIRQGEAKTILANLLETVGDEHFDLAFIDADKLLIQNYFQQCLQLIRPGGMIVIDNVLFKGLVVEPDQQADNVQAIRQLNETVHQHPLVEGVILPIQDGMWIIRKRKGALLNE